MANEAGSSIDIEEIIANIRNEIDSQFSPEDILEFEPRYSSKPDSAIPSVGYDLDFFNRALVCVQNTKTLSIPARFPGGPISVFAKRIVKKLSTCVLGPLVDKQNAFNAEVTNVLFQMSAKLKEQDETIESLMKKNREH